MGYTKDQLLARLQVDFPNSFFSAITYVVRLSNDFVIGWGKISEKFTNLMAEFYFILLALVNMFRVRICSTILLESIYFFL